MGAIPFTRQAFSVQWWYYLIAFLAISTSSGKDFSAGQVKTIQGWTVHVDEKLLSHEAEATEKALRLLEQQLVEIVEKVPAEAMVKLREVPLWFSPEYDGISARAEYHPNERWLRANGRNPAMVKAVEFTNVRIFEREVRRMPNFTLHELAHAFHDRVLSFDQPEVIARFENAKTGRRYDDVERTFGNGRPNVREKAYAMSNHKEYFAETTEAFFSRNDFFPFTRDELARHDPEMFTLLGKLWGEPGK